MERQIITAAKKVFIGVLLKSKVDESGKIILPYGVLITRARILGSLVSKTVSPDRRYTRITIDDGSGSMNYVDFDIKREPNYVYGCIYDIIVSLRYASSRGLSGVVEVAVKVPDEQVNIARELRRKEIAKIEELLTPKAEGGSRVQ